MMVSRSRRQDFWAELAINLLGQSTRRGKHCSGPEKGERCHGSSEQDEAFAGANGSCLAYFGLGVGKNDGGFGLAGSG